LTAQQQALGPVSDQAVVERGQQLLTEQCGFCHGSNARGGSGGPDLTRSALVHEDENGRQLGEFLRVGRPDRGMPKFDMTDARHRRFSPQRDHGDYTGRRYSTLKQINTGNVKGLTLAWVYRLNTSRSGAIVGGEGPDTPPPGNPPAIKSTPLMINGVLTILRRTRACPVRWCRRTRAVRRTGRRRASIPIRASCTSARVRPTV
jgi:hypothetical protein